MVNFAYQYNVHATPPYRTLSGAHWLVRGKRLGGAHAGESLDEIRCTGPGSVHETTARAWTPCTTTFDFDTSVHPTKQPIAVWERPGNLTRLARSLGKGD